MTLVKTIEPILHGRDPAVQGAVLADLVATFFAGHHPELREDAIKVWIDIMRVLISFNERELFSKHGKPEGWP